MRNGSFRQKVFKLSFPKHQQFIGRMLKWLNEGKMDCVNNSNTIGALNSLFFEVASANNRQISFNMREKNVCTRQKWFRPLSPFSVCVCFLFRKCCLLLRRCHCCFYMFGVLFREALYKRTEHPAKNIQHSSTSQNFANKHVWLCECV